MSGPYSGLVFLRDRFADDRGLDKPLHGRTGVLDDTRHDGDEGVEGDLLKNVESGVVHTLSRRNELTG